MREYTKLEYLSPVESVPPGDDGSLITLAVKIILWGCPECGATVFDQNIHEWWHRNYVHQDDVKPWWRRNRNA